MTPKPSGVVWMQPSAWSLTCSIQFVLLVRVAVSKSKWCTGERAASGREKQNANFPIEDVFIVQI
jgi:hypothetical protein